MAIDKGFDIRSCYLCRYHGEDKSKDLEYDPEIGMFLEPERGCRRDLEKQGLLPCNPDDARTCEHFILKDYSIKGSLNAYSNATLFVWEKHPDGTVKEEYRKGKTEETDFADFDNGYYIV